MNRIIIKPIVMLRVVMERIAAMRTVMTWTIGVVLLLPMFGAGVVQGQKNPSNPLRVHVTGGLIEGAADSSDVLVFRGIPYAAPPVGPLRWREPQPVQGWAGVRPAKEFSARPPQKAMYKDMVFRSKKTSEDCLYLNVWTTAGAIQVGARGRNKSEGAVRSGNEGKAAAGGLPVLVYFHGGGLVTGDGSETRYDGASMARKGIVVVTVNYRLGVFGFLAYPELTKESPHHSSGNYGLLDQNAALQWVRKNIAAFGGDPARVTIDGQSAGSMSVSAQMASPLSAGLFAGAIGESGSMLGPQPPASLQQGEENGVHFAEGIGAHSLDELRKLPTDVLEDAAVKPGAHFPTLVDGYFLPEAPVDIYTKGKQADVPLLAGWNSAEISGRGLLGDDAPTPENFKKAVEKIYGDKAEEVVKLYPGTTPDEVMKAATELASDRFLAYSTWKWIDLHGKTDGKRVYRYLYAHPLPPMRESVQDASNAPASIIAPGPAPVSLASRPGAPHSAEIAYALGNLSVYDVYDWKPADYTVSAVMQGYFVNFIKNGDPNGPSLPIWPGLQSSIPKVMVIDDSSGAQPERNQRRYQFLDSFRPDR